MKNSKLWLILLLFTALLLRVPLLNGSFWLDEAAQALESARPLSQQFEIIPDFQPPLLHLLIHLALYVSSAEWWLRTVGALIPGLITVWATYRIGQKLANAQVGLMAGLLLATSSFHIFFSQELRQYALPAMWGALSWLVLLHSKELTTTKASGLNWSLFTLLTSLGLYTSFLYPFLCLAQLLWAHMDKKTSLKGCLIAMLVAGISFLPWMPTFFLQLEAGGEVRRELPGWSEVVSIPQLKSLPLVAGKFIFGVMNLEFNATYSLLGVLILVATAVTVRGLDLKNKLPLNTIKLLSIWLILPLLTAWVVSFWIPILQPKRVLFLLPAFYLGVGALVSMSKKVWFKYSSFGVLLFINLVSTVSYYTQPGLQRENWRAAYQEIVTKYPPQQTIAVFAFPEPFAPWRWYDSVGYPTLSTKTLHISQVENLTQTLTPINKYQFVVVFEYLTDLTDPDNLLLKEIEAYKYTTVEVLEYPNLGFVRIYRKNITTASTL